MLMVNGLLLMMLYGLFGPLWAYNTIVQHLHYLCVSFFLMHVHGCVILLCMLIYLLEQYMVNALLVTSLITQITTNAQMENQLFKYIFTNTMKNMMLFYFKLMNKYKVSKHFLLSYLLYFIHIDKRLSYNCKLHNYLLKEMLLRNGDS